MTNLNGFNLRFIFGAAIATCLAHGPVFAQQQPSQLPASQDLSVTQPPKDPAPASAQPSAQATEEVKQKQREEQTGTSTDRLFWTLPNFLTVKNEGSYPSLGPAQKFSVVARSSFDYVEYPWYAFLAGISQAQNSEPSYGQGAEGYGKRYGTAFADGTIENFMTGAALPSLLRQDPRYYQLGEGGFWHRTAYAVSRLFVTRSDSGSRQFDFSEVCGSGMSAAISAYGYHPSSDQNLSSVLSAWGTQVGWDGATLVVKEFWPDVKRKLSSRQATR